MRVTTRYHLDLFSPSEQASPWCHEQLLAHILPELTILVSSPHVEVSFSSLLVVNLAWHRSIAARFNSLESLQHWGLVNFELILPLIKCATSF